MEKELEQQVLKSIAGKLGMENLNSDYSVYYDVPLFSMDDPDGVGFGLDSIDALEVVIAIKENFDVKITDEEMTVLKSVSTIANFIREKKNA